LAISISLPDFEKSIGNRRTIAIEQVALHNDSLALRPGGNLF
jgi:hypothetical protein